jgi:hypothetical protein
MAGTARVAASTGRWLILISGVTSFFPCCWRPALHPNRAPRRPYGLGRPSNCSTSTSHAQAAATSHLCSAGLKAETANHPANVYRVWPARTSRGDSCPTRGAPTGPNRPPHVARSTVVASPGQAPIPVKIALVRLIHPGAMATTPSITARGPSPGWAPDRSAPTDRQSIAGCHTYENGDGGAACWHAGDGKDGTRGGGRVRWGQQVELEYGGLVGRQGQQPWHQDGEERRHRRVGRGHLLLRADVPEGAG